jgi:nitric oxide reductase NorE protein
MTDIADRPLTSARQAHPEHGWADRDAAVEARRWVPGEPGIWALILTDLLIFAFYFITFMLQWHDHPTVFAHGREELNLNIGILNTFFLLTASLFVALGVQTLRRGETKLTQRLFLGAAFSGSAFIVDKIIEWSREVNHGFTPKTDVFFQMYYMMTGIHLAHVLIAMTLLFFMRRRAQAVVGLPTPKQSRFVENCATYWHMVDLLWLGILALFYLIG